MEPLAVVEVSAWSLPRLLAPDVVYVDTDFAARLEPFDLAEREKSFVWRCKLSAVGEV